jgi:hypothetical protein
MCFWIVLKIRFSNTLPIVDKRVIESKLRGNFLSLPGFGRVKILAFCKVPGSDQTADSDYINVLTIPKVFLEDIGDINLECRQNHRHFLISRTLFSPDPVSEINRCDFINGSQQCFEFNSTYQWS